MEESDEVEFDRVSLIDLLRPKSFLKKPFFGSDLLLAGGGMFGTAAAVTLADAVGAAVGGTAAIVVVVVVVVVVRALLVDGCVGIALETETGFSALVDEDVIVGVTLVTSGDAVDTPLAVASLGVVTGVLLPPFPCLL